MKFVMDIQNDMAFFSKHDEEYAYTWWEFFTDKEIMIHRIKIYTSENTNYKHLERMLKYEM